MAILSFLTDLVDPVIRLIKGLTGGNDIEKQKLTNAVSEMQSQIALRLLDLQSQLIEARSSVIKAEAQGQSWIQRSWRPVTMLTFLVLVVSDLFGLLAFRLPDDAWTLLQIGLGGYIVGRSGEKVTQMLKNKKII